MPKVKDTKKPAGRLSTYTDEIGDRICELIASDHSIREIAGMPGMPDRTTIARWFDNNESFAAKCVRAREWRADYVFDDMRSIEERVLIGQVDAAAGRTVLSSKQWRAEKLDRGRFGSRQQVEMSGGIEVKQTRDPGALAAEITELLADPEVQRLLKP